MNKLQSVILSTLLVVPLRSGVVCARVSACAPVHAALVFVSSFVSDHNTRALACVCARA